MTGVRRALLFVWAAALPFHRLPFATPMPRAGAGEWLFPLALVALAPWRGLAWRRQLALPLVLAVGFAPSVLRALDPRVAALQLGVLLYVAMIFLLAREAAVRGFGRVVLAGFACGAVLSAAAGWAWPQQDAWLVAGWSRPLGLTESPNMLAIVSATGALAAFVVARQANGRGRLAWFAGGGALVATALATLGHVVFAAVVAVTVVLAREARWRVASFSIAAAGASIAALLASTRIRLLPLSTTFPFFDRRPNLYAAAHTVDFEVFRDHPLTGVGLECFAKVWRRYDDGHRFAAAFVGGQEHLIGVPIDTHSTWLGYLAEGGLFGALALVVLVILALRARRSGGRATGELDVLLVFAAGMGLFADVLTSRELALVAGALLGHAVVARVRTPAAR